MLSPGGRDAPLSRPALLVRVAVLTALLAVGTCSTGSRSCPRSLDCARAGRHFCPVGSSYCGPCLNPLVENSHGRCVVKRQRVAHFGQKTSFIHPELDEEIDFLSTIITEHRQTQARPPVSLPGQGGVTVPEGTERLGSKPTNTPVPASAPPTDHTLALAGGPAIVPYPSDDHPFIVMSSVFIGAGSLALVVAGVCWVRLQKGVRLSQKVEYPAYGLMRAQSYDNSVPGDKKLAHSAQMYHYQHQKQQMLSLEKHLEEPKVTDSGATSDEETEDGDFTVYECPGLAPTGEMEVKNPLFDDSTLYLQRFHK